MTGPPRSPTPAPSPGGRRLVLVALVLLALNLRPAAVSVGPVLAEVVDGLAMSHTMAGVLTSLPVLAFAGFGALAPAAARILGVHRTIGVSLLAVTLGLGLRVLVDSTYPFLALSLLALAGMATANVLLPSLVRLHFADRVGTVTALYSTSLAIGLTCALLLTAPIAQTQGGWRAGLGVWAVLALIALLPWLALVTRDRRGAVSSSPIRMAAVARTPLGLAMAGFFGVQSMHAYTAFGWFAQLWRDAGYSPVEAGVLIGILAAISIPLSLTVPSLAARREDQRGILLALIACYPVGYVGLMVAPYSLALLWAVLVGIGSSCFPLALSLIALRARTPEGTAALSGFTQAAGYLLAAIGPMVIAALYDATGSWDVPLIVLLAMVVPQLLFGLRVARPGSIEDQLDPGRLGRDAR